MHFYSKKLKLIKGDASFRKFYRIKGKKKSSILVYANKEKKKNLLIYDAINKLLIKNKITAPKLYSHNYKKNYLEIEDFGSISIYHKLKKNKKILNKIKLLKKVINLLNKIQRIKQKKIKNFLNQNYKIENYTNQKLLTETNLFLEWYIPRVINKKKRKKLINKLKIIFIKLLSKLKNSNNILVHRDFHVSNLMYYKKKIGVIDTQDAVSGNIAYDLASLVDDVRYKTSKKFKEKIYNEFIRSKKINSKNLKNDFEILSVLRNLKIIGIFTRLSIRDKKDNYLRLIPYAWKLIELRINKNNNFKELKLTLDNYFSKKIRRLK